MEIIYKGFSIKSYYAVETGVFYGELNNSSTVISIQATNLDDFKAYSISAIEDYLQAHDLITT